MKMIKILQAVSLLLILMIFVSCRSSRPTTGKQYPRGYPTEPYPEYPGRDYPVYKSYPKNMPPGQAKKVYGGRSAKPYAPGQRKKHGYTYRQYPLIVTRAPGIVIHRYNDGRYFYRNPEGYTYWKGYDDRFYLDEKYLNDEEYDENEYNEWKNRGRKSYGNDYQKGKNKSKNKN
ncbi:MAG TPA: hypothetical protein VJ765_07025 [Chitinophagaceae bacterium]|nr:hypothetical protein [Chitinophagaceae bacterium]